MKKYLFSALALPLLFACSSDDLIEKEVASNDQFPGIEKVDATFSMDEGAITRFDNGGGFTPEEGDLWGFAWLTDAHTAEPAYTASIGIDGKAYQNHNLVQTNGVFEPQTSIYVGKYFLYRPYDESTVSPQKINFSLENQPMAQGYASTTDAWKALAETAINIGDKWTEVTPTGYTVAPDPTVWNKAGIKQHYAIYGAFFSNQTGLDLTYVKNNPTFTAATTISGATDINHTFAAGTDVGAADIYSGTVQLTGAANSFTYGPTAEPNAGAHSGTYWADKENLGAAQGFAFVDGAITLNSPDADEDGVLDGISTGVNGNTAWFWFNSLPVTNGVGDAGTVITPVFETSYGTVTVKKSYSPDVVAYTVGDCAYALNIEGGQPVWHPLANDADNTTSPTTWAVAGTAAGKETFINQYGNHKGKFTLTVDFSKGVMNNMHIKSDVQLRKLLKYYLASGKTETDVVLNLDGNANKEFKISKISIALLQTIGGKVKVQACGEHNNPVKIIVTQDGQADLGLADNKEVPALNNVFAVATDVYLAKNTEWTWTEGAAAEGKIPGGILPIDENVRSLTNEGNLTVNATNVQLSEIANVAAQPTIYNAKSGTITLTEVTTVKNTLNNLGTINVPAGTELRAYGIAITNDANTILMPENIIAAEVPADGVVGIINNSGVVGTSAGTNGHFYNFGGLIYMQDPEAMTFLTSNELKAGAAASAFSTPFGETNKMGTVVLPEGKPEAIVSVSNQAENGFITYKWDEPTYSKATTNVKYNTLIVEKDIEFTGEGIASEVQFLLFNGVKTKVVNPASASKLATKGVIVPAGKSFILEKTNRINNTVGAYVGEGATVYRGGAFLLNGVDFVAANCNSYFGGWSLDQIVEY